MARTIENWEGGGGGGGRQRRWTWGFPSLSHILYPQLSILPTNQLVAARLGSKPCARLGGKSMRLRWHFFNLLRAIQGAGIQWNWRVSFTKVEKVFVRNDCSRLCALSATQIHLPSFSMNNLNPPPIFLSTLFCVISKVYRKRTTRPLDQVEIHCELTEVTLCSSIQGDQ